jgi:glutamine synthetase
MQVESAKGECNFGQHEIAFLYEDALRTCDNHVVYKTAAKEIAAQEGYALTFMAKYNEREGNSCHIHLSFRGTDGSMVMADKSDEEHGLSTVGRQFIAGQLAHLRELSLMFAPNINSYKRFAPGSFAPTSIEWGRDNRTCALRLVGRGAGLRVENRVPGGDCNPYLAVAAMVAAGLDGIEKGLELRPEEKGNAYASTGEKVPWRLADAVDLWEGSAWIADTFGEEVQQHYVNMGRVEIEDFARTITDWERYRGFERL